MFRVHCCNGKTTKNNWHKSRASLILFHTFFSFLAEIKKGARENIKKKEKEEGPYDTAALENYTELTRKSNPFETIKK